jgi:very-short-patch-repair endonuclease
LVRTQQGDGKGCRHHPIGRSIVDFYCHEPRLAVAIDGDTDAVASQAAFDEARTQWHQDHGYRVLRLRDAEVAREMETALAALAAILEACSAKDPHPNPSRASRERGRK